MSVAIPPRKSRVDFIADVSIIDNRFRLGGLFRFTSVSHLGPVSSDSAPLRAPRAGRRLHSWARCAQCYRSYDYELPH